MADASGVAGSDCDVERYCAGAAVGRSESAAAKSNDAGVSSGK